LHELKRASSQYYENGRHKEGKIRGKHATISMVELKLKRSYAIGTTLL